MKLAEFKNNDRLHLHSSEHGTLTNGSISDATTEQSVSSCKKTNLMGTMGIH